MTGMSATATDCTAAGPMPGHWNTVSVTRENATIPPKLKADDGDDGNQRVLQGVAEIDRPVGQAAGAGEFDVVGAQDFQHLGTHQSHDQGHLEQTERDGGQDEGADAGQGGESL